MGRKIIAMLLASTMLMLGGCSVDVTVNENGKVAVDDISSEESSKVDEAQDHIAYSFATKEEGIDLLMSNTEYYDGFTQNDLDYKMQKKNA